MCVKSKKLFYSGLICLLLLCQASFATALMPDQVGYWPLDGDPCDALGLHHGTNMGDPGPTYEAGVIGQAAKFTGVNGEGWIAITDQGDWDPRDGQDDLTVSIWTLRTWKGSQGQLFLQRNSSQWSNGALTWFVRRGDADTRFGDFNDMANDPTDPPQNEWHHVVGVYDGTAQTGILYVDGVEIARDDDWPQLGGWPKNAITIGALSNGNQAHEGMADDARLFKRALTPEEVMELYEFDGNPAYNFSPVIKNLPEINDVGTNETFQLGATAEDDGLPFMEAVGDAQNPTIPDEPTSVGLAFEWTVIDPNELDEFDPVPHVQFNDNTLLDPCITIDLAGAYILQLTAYDDKDGVSPQTQPDDPNFDGLGGKTKVAQVTVSVLDNVEPVIDGIAVDPAGQLILSVDNSAALDATVTNDDATNYSWEVLDPCAFFVENIQISPSADSEDVELIFDQAALGEWLRLPAGQAREIPVKLTVTDSMNQTDSMTVTLEVRDPDCTIAIQEHGLAVDFNGDCEITLEDLLEMINDWLACYDPLSEDPLCDNPYAP